MKPITRRLTIKQHRFKSKKLKRFYFKTRIVKNDPDAKKYSSIKNDESYLPTILSDLDEGRSHCIMSDELDDPGHPGFKDPDYRKRRNFIAKIAREYKMGDVIPRVEYTDNERETWKFLYNKLTSLFSTHACEQYNEILPLLSKNCGMTSDNIPQLDDISKFLKNRTGFTLAPVSGLLAPRYFLNALAFKVFNSTQYVRHASVPDYTPEPDIAHELVGHVPLLADPDFANFTHIVGLASLGASEEDINRLSRCYWFTVEFGLVRQNGLRKAVGAGLLSSFGELQYCLSNEPQVKDFDPFIAANQEYPITKYQPLYFIADSFNGMKDKMEVFAKSLKRPHTVEFNEKTWSVKYHKV